MSSSFPTRSATQTGTLSRLISDRIPAVDWASFLMKDWLLLLQAAEREGVGPLLYWKSSKSGNLACLPGPVRESLRGWYAQTWAQNQKIIRELAIVARLFHEAGIPTVVLKGACLALTIYPGIGLRPMGDLDILVPSSKLSLAVQLAKSLGYQDLIPEASVGLSDLLDHAVCLYKPDKQSFPLEIHRSLVADRAFKYAVPVDWFWEQTEPLRPLEAKLGLEHLLMLNPTAQLLYAASHAMLQHGGSKTPLRWYYDLDQLIRLSNGRLDWELLLSQARRFQWSSALQAALFQTHEFFDTPLPEEVCLHLSQTKDRLRALVALKQDQPATHTLEERRKLLSLNWKGKLRLTLALLFPSPAYMRWRYKFQSLRVLPIWYLIRWTEILRDGIRTLIAIVQAKAQVR